MYVFNWNFILARVFYDREKHEIIINITFMLRICIFIPLHICLVKLKGYELNYLRLVKENGRLVKCCRELGSPLIQ